VITVKDPKTRWWRRRSPEIPGGVGLDALETRAHVFARGGGGFAKKGTEAAD